MAVLGQDEKKGNQVRSSSKTRKRERGREKSTGSLKLIEKKGAKRKGLTLQ